MNAMPASQLRSRLGILAALALLLAGCATHRVDWAPRIGNYTMDQAVLDYGPPDKQARLQDGTVVADWLLRRAQTFRTVSPGYYAGHYRYYDPFYPMYNESSTPDYLLRLTFGPDGKLSAWKNFIR